MEDKRIAFGGAIKSLGGRRKGGYLVRFTSPDERDFYGEYFDETTNFQLDDHPLDGKPILFNHGMDKRLGMARLGVIDHWEVRTAPDSEGNRGIWIEWEDEYTEEKREYVDAVNRLHERHVREFGHGNGLSSGAYPTSVLVDEDTKHIKQWVIVEGSETPTPADPGNQLSLKSLIDLHNDLLRELIAKEAPSTSQDKTHSKQSKGATKMDDLLQKIMEMISTYMDEMKADMPEDEDPERMSDEEYKMDDKEQKAIAAEVAKSFKAQIEKALEIAANGTKPTDEQIERAVKSYADEMLSATAERYFAEIEARKARKAQIIAEARANAARNATSTGKSDGAGGRRGNGNGSTALSVNDVTPYDDWTPADFSFAMDMARQSERLGKSSMVPRAIVTQPFMKQFADRVAKAHQSGEIRLSPQGIKAVNAIKSDELDYSTQSGYGDEWVFTSWADQIWDKPRLDLVYTQLNVVDMPSNPYEMPTESTDPTVYYVTETADENQLGRNDSNAAIPDTKIATNKVQLNAKKHALRVTWSAELDEDAVGSYLPKFRAQAQRAVEDAIEKSVLLGDTSTSGNINLDGATPGGTLSYMAYDGIVHQALVTASTNAVDAGGASPTLAHLRSIRAKLGNAQGYNPNNLAIFTDFPTYMKLLSIDAVVTIDKIGNQATVATGSLGQIDGINVFVSGQMALADADGKITSGGNTVDRGRLALVYKPDWYLGYRRRVASDLKYLAFADAWELVLTVRTALSARSYSSAGAQQSSDDSVAVLYNIGV